MEYISMLNPYSFYYLYQDNNGKQYLINFINKIINSKDNYVLENYFNNNFNDVKSYVIFTSNDKIIIIDFIFKKNIIHNDILYIKDFLTNTSNEKVYLLVLHNYIGKTNINNDIYNIYQNSLSDNFIFAKTYLAQLKINSDLTKYLYSMPIEYLKLYKHEKALYKNTN